MESNYRVYKYTNIITNQKYVGTTHLYQSNRSGKKGEKYIKMCNKFGDAILEYNWENFKYEVLEEGLTKEEAFEKEKYWIEKENSLWPNGYNLEDGGKKGHSVNNETKEKMKKTREGEYICRPVRQYTLDGQFVAEYSSIREAQRQIGNSHISECCLEKRNTAGGFIWKYAELEE